MGCFLPPFNPDVWPPSNPSRRGTVATGSARGLKTWLFTVSGRLWHNGLCFNRTFCRPQTLPGRVRLPLAAGFGTMGCFLPAFNPDVWPPSNPSRQGTAATGCRLWHNGLFFTGFQSGRLATLKPFPAGYGCHWLQALAQWAVFYRLSIRTFGRPQTLPGRVRLPLAAGFGTMGCFLPAFNPDVWPPSNPSRRGTVATGSARGLKTWPTGCRLWHNGLFFTGFQSGRLAALKRFPAGYGCHWLQALAQWAVFYRLSIRTFGRHQTLPGGVRLPLPLLGASKLGISPFPAGSGTMGCVSTPVTPDVLPPSNPSRQGTAATGCRLWHNGLFFTGFQSGRLAALKPFPAGYGCHWLQALAQWAVFYRLSIRTFGRPQTLPGGVRLPLALQGASKLGPLAAGFGTMGCFLPAFNPDVWPPSNASRQGTAFPAGYGCHWLC